GKPILEVITGNGLYNTVIVVTRYFGGTLLGTGGLVRAYTQAAQEGICNSVIVEKIPGKRITLSLDYTDLGKVQYLLAQDQMLIESTDYTDRVMIHCLFPDTDKDLMKKKITEATGGRVKMEEEEEVYFGEAEGKVVVFEK
ncbi:MAG: YigZ family protein, partial [Eubacterium sp.]|nr:YigZ family protein [Eubacterium sp.]